MANQYDTRKAILDAGLSYPVNTNEMNNAVKNFSALNTPSGYSSLGSQMAAQNQFQNIQPKGFSSLGQQMNANNVPMPTGRFSAISDKGGSVTPPNFKNNLLDYILSPKGKGMAQGLLEASGYSDTPVTFGQALAMGIKRGNEAEASAATSGLARDKFNYQKEQDILNRALEYAKIGDVNVPALQQNISACLKHKV